MKPFNHNYFLGYINEITAQYVKIHFPSSNLLHTFYHEGLNFTGGNVGKFIVIEGEEYGFLARITELNLPDSERKEINEKAIYDDTTLFHPSGKAELLLTFNLFEPNKTQKTVSNYPHIGAKVYACSDEQISKYIKEFGKKENNIDAVYAPIGKLTANDALCNVSLDSLFGRHCAVIGTTGGGKSWTVAKLIEGITEYTNNKVILIDATGEYKNLTNNSYILGVDSYFPYQELSIPDLFYLLRPTGQSQRPILLEAIRSLKIKHLQGENSTYVKTNTLKSIYKAAYETYIKDIENNLCNFDINLLVQQIKEECVYQGANYNKDQTKWGDYDAKTYDYQTSLIARITDLLNTDIFKKLLGFNNIPGNISSIINIIDDFLSSSTGGILRISFEDIPSSFSAKEIVSNALATYLLQKARSKDFVKNPVVLFLDEAHQFLNKGVKDEFFEIHSLDAFDLIAKEARKYGLFLCLSTQMPRDIPVGTLS
ncbi:ATP-binding protein [Treponema denticola]